MYRFDRLTKWYIYGLGALPNAKQTTLKLHGSSIRTTVNTKTLVERKNKAGIQNYSKVK